MATFTMGMQPPSIRARRLRLAPWALITALVGCQPSSPPAPPPPATTAASPPPVPTAAPSPPAPTSSPPTPAKADAARLFAEAEAADEANDCATAQQRYEAAFASDPRVVSALARAAAAAERCGRPAIAGAAWERTARALAAATGEPARVVATQPGSWGGEMAAMRDEDGVPLASDDGRVVVWSAPWLLSSRDATGRWYPERSFSVERVVVLSPRFVATYEELYPPPGNIIDRLTGSVARDGLASFVARSADGHRLAWVDGAKALVVVAADDLRELTRIPDAGDEPRFVGSDHVLTRHGQGHRLFDLRTSQRVAELEGDEVRPSLGGTHLAVLRTTDAHQVTLVGVDGQVRATVTTERHQGVLGPYVAFHPEDRFAVVAADDGTFRLVTLPDGKVTAYGQPRTPKPNERLGRVVVSRDGDVCVSTTDAQGRYESTPHLLLHTAPLRAASAVEQQRSLCLVPGYDGEAFVIPTPHRNAWTSPRRTLLPFVEEGQRAVSLPADVSEDGALVALLEATRAPGGGYRDLALLLIDDRRQLRHRVDLPALDVTADVAVRLSPDAASTLLELGGRLLWIDNAAGRLLADLRQPDIDMLWRRDGRAIYGYNNVGGAWMDDAGKVHPRAPRGPWNLGLEGAEGLFSFGDDASSEHYRIDLKSGRVRSVSAPPSSALETEGRDGGLHVVAERSIGFVVEAAEGAAIGTLEVHPGWALARLADGRVELIGPAPADAVHCAWGDRHAPLAACRELLAPSGTWDKLLKSRRRHRG